MQVMIQSRVSKNLKKKITSLSDFVTYQLLTAEQREYLNVYVDIDNEIDLQGFCEPTWEEDYGLESQSEISVFLNKSLCADENEFLKLVAHEFVHVSQLASGRLQMFDDGMFFLGSRTTDISYALRPEELEAYSLENVLLSEWMCLT